MVLTYCGIIVVVLIFLNYFPLLVARNFIISTNQEEMLSTSNAVAQRIQETGSLDRLAETMQDQMNYMNLKQYGRVLVTDKNAVVLFDNYSMTGSNDITGKRAMFSKEIFQALKGQETFVNTFKKDYFEFTAATPILIDDEVEGTVYLFKQSYNEATLLTGTQHQLLIFSLLISAMVLGFSIFLSLILTEQIKVLSGGVKHMQEGDFQARIKVTTNDELGGLANAFNTLNEKLWDTDEKRKQFVSDASHELKTPLASIKLLVDSINSSPDMDKGLLNEFLMDISNEIDRLVRITEHLFILTRMDSDIVGVSEEIDAEAEVNKALRTFTPIANAKGIRLNYLTEPNCYIWGSMESFSHVVYNLIDNAIKYNYTEENGYVSVRLYPKDGMVYFVVKDNGIGIAPEDQDKIFGRFYRVDKARSRETGGTGLGLSIVESNVKMLGGTITLDSEVGKGSTFTVKIPLFQEEEETTTPALPEK